MKDILFALETQVARHNNIVTRIETLMSDSKTFGELVVNQGHIIIDLLEVCQAYGYIVNDITTKSIAAVDDLEKAYKELAGGHDGK